MIYSHFTLTQACLLTGLLLVLIAGAALARTTSAMAWLRTLPRSRFWGVGLLGLAAAWSFYLISTIDLGEFTDWRLRLQIIIIVAAYLTAKFVDEFLAARALGMVLLLAAEPLLEAAFLRPEQSRLFLVVLAYVGIVQAMFWIGMPYALRDQITWLIKAPARLRGAGIAAGVYGAVLVILGLTLHH